MGTKAKGRRKSATKKNSANKDAKAPVTGGDSIHSRAMLVALHVSVWTARRFDRKVSDEINKQKNASEHAGRYNKHLFGGAKTSHGKVSAAASKARTRHYEQTLPWSDEGWRLLPSANYFEYTEGLREMRGEFDTAVAEFVSEYGVLVEDAKKELGELWRHEDYPPATVIGTKFGVKADFAPVPAEGDFRLDLPLQNIQEIEATVADRVRQATAVAMRDAWDRLYKVVAVIHERLTREPRDDGEDRTAHIRQPMIDAAREIADVLGRLNVTNDPALEAMRERVAQNLTFADADTLREDNAVREATAKQAEKILNEMKDIYGGPSDDDD